MYENEIPEKDNVSVIYQVIQSDIKLRLMKLRAISIMKLSADF